MVKLGFMEAAGWVYTGNSANGNAAVETGSAFGFYPVEINSRPLASVVVYDETDQGFFL